MMRRMMWLAAGVLLASCGTGEQAPSGNGQAAGRTTISALDRLDLTRARACMSDAECGPSENCECPASGDNGNCEAPGVCVPRDSRVASVPSTGEKSVAPGADLLTCRSMRNLSFIPAGFHPTTARWELDAGGQTNDMVCLARSDTRQIRVLRWLDYPLPAGYHTLRTETGVDTNFRGCRQWTIWQGTTTCVASWDLYVMQKDG